LSRRVEPLEFSSDGGNRIREVDRIRARGLKPRRSLGQHFLFDHRILDVLVESAGVGPGDFVLEVGCGSGALTRRLLARGAHVVGVEIDRNLCALLREDLAQQGTFSLVEGDVLAGKHKLNPEVREAVERFPKKGKVVGNLPFSTATPLVIRLLRELENLEVIVVTVQLEVADRLTAEPGGSAYGALSVMARALADVEKVRKIDRRSFWPRPKVHGAVVRLVPRAEGRPPEPVLAALEAVVRAGFDHRRKRLRKVLQARWPLLELNDIVPEEARAGDLPPESYVALAERLARSAGSAG